jgi:hypothetical protein
MLVEIDESNEAVFITVYFAISLSFTVSIGLSVTLSYEFFTIMAFWFECLDSHEVFPTHQFHQRQDKVQMCQPEYT